MAWSTRKTAFLLSSLAMLSLDAQELSTLSIREVIYYTLQQQWSVMTSELNIATQAALLQEASGAFNPLLTAGYSREFLRDLQTALGMKTNLNGNTTTSNIGLQTLSRIGTTYGIAYQNTNTNDLALGPRTDESTLTFSVTQPILRDFLFSPQTTTEKTQRLQVKVARLQNVQNVAQAITNSITAYWEFVSAKRVLAIQIAQEELLKKILNYAQALVKEDQEGYATLYQPEGNYDQQVANRIQAEQTVKSTYNALLFAMGLIPDDHPDIPEIICEEYPLSQKICALTSTWYDANIDELCQNRADLVAANVSIEIADLNLRSAKNGLLPLVNLIGAVELQNTTGLRHNGVFDSSDFHRPQKDYTIGFNFSFPLYNDAAKGLVRQDRAARQQAYVNAGLLESQAISSFKTGFTFYNQIYDAIQKLKASALEYQDSVEAEILKLREGISTYFFVLQLQQNWLQILLQRELAEKLFAENVTQMQFLAGKLVKWPNIDREVELEDVDTSLNMFLLDCPTQHAEVPPQPEEVDESAS